MSRATVILGLIICLYFSVSFLIFNAVYETSNLVVDELFHIPQGLQYCAYNFSHWDPKLTTLPGLYIVSMLVSSPFPDCTAYLLRFTNLLASSVNLYLFVSLIRQNHDTPNILSLKTVFRALNLAFLPPLYFFSHLYYTDTLSLTFVLLFLKFSFSKKTFIAAHCAVFSVLMRQTNIVWIAFSFGHKFLDALYRSYIKNLKGKDNSKKSKSTNSKEVAIKIYSINDSFNSAMFHLKTGFKHFFKWTPSADLCDMFSLLCVLCGFILFVYVNGSIVVGDKSAHSASIHLPQIFYFTLFYAIFSLPSMFLTVKKDVKRLFESYSLLAVEVVVCIAIVYFNTIVHPYLLADNRHYTFYIWNRFYGRYEFAKYAVVPLYIYVLRYLWDKMRQKGVGFLLPFTAALVVSLVPQRMLEIRYFLPPFVVLRLWLNNPPWSVVVTESVLYAVINYVAFSTFFTKEIYWTDFSDVQRLMW